MKLSNTFLTDLAGLTTGAVATLFLAARIREAVNDPAPTVAALQVRKAEAVYFGAC